VSFNSRKIGCIQWRKVGFKVFRVEIEIETGYGVYFFQFYSDGRKNKMDER